MECAVYFAIKRKAAVEVKPLLERLIALHRRNKVFPGLEGTEVTVFSPSEILFRMPAAADCEDACILAAHLLTATIGSGDNWAHVQSGMRA